MSHQYWTCAIGSDRGNGSTGQDSSYLWTFFSKKNHEILDPKFVLMLMLMLMLMLCLTDMTFRGRSWCACGGLCQLYLYKQWWVKLVYIHRVGNGRILQRLLTMHPSALRPPLAVHVLFLPIRPVHHHAIHVTCTTMPCLLSWQGIVFSWQKNALCTSVNFLSVSWGSYRVQTVLLMENRRGRGVRCQQNSIELLRFGRKKYDARSWLRS